MKNINETETFDSSEYPIIVNDVMSYVIEQKEKNNKAPILDLISDFCLKFDYPILLVGDAISDDCYFKSLIESDCGFHEMENKKTNVLADEW